MTTLRSLPQDFGSSAQSLARSGGGEQLEPRAAAEIGAELRSTAPMFESADMWASTAAILRSQGLETAADAADRAADRAWVAAAQAESALAVA
ncbi:hypothetical protein Q5424_01250 [Conexibacter sp. JD483]|uniref:hypothetical protein n=1 Tax=unclassified Conexibacter TaxID=2627773 RepID=UPI00272404BC|nr:MULTISPECIES: hypothetical protein [unclassified Conexibacter]MDO8185855.1 hypothetical protein [Conexibacter sp. CPCC 205706]MDO8198599.1 hypothetical protein [Conexibacter sp. CPCC 205762]MDR9367685.1 hypothetical protein [Conexibacter sp. JD483]